MLVPSTFRQTTKLREAMRSTSDEKLQDWRDMCQKNSIEIQEYTSWVDYTEFLSTLPTLRGRKYEELLKQDVLQEMRVDDGRYYFVITDIRRAGDAAPLERVRETIKRILFNQRQSEIIRAHEERIYEEALASGDLRINLGDEEPTEEQSEELTEQVDEAAEQPVEQSAQIDSTQSTQREPKQTTDTIGVVVSDTINEVTK